MLNLDVNEDDCNRIIWAYVILMRLENLHTFKFTFEVHFFILWKICVVYWWQIFKKRFVFWSENKTSSVWPTNSWQIVVFSIHFNFYSKNNSFLIKNYKKSHFNQVFFHSEKTFDQETKTWLTIYTIFGIILLFLVGANSFFVCHRYQIVATIRNISEQMQLSIED